MEFLNLVIEEGPQVLILMGPFVDTNNDLVESGDILLQNEPLDYQELFITFVQVVKTHLKVFII